MLKCDLLWSDGPRFYFDTELFQPSTDSFALAYFAHVRPDSRVCDLGSGTGLLGILLLARQPSLHISCIELLPEANRLAKKSFAENGWSDAVTLRCGDLRESGVLPDAGSMDVCISNPPYFRSGSGKAALGAARQAARCEDSCTLDELCAAASRILRFGGSFFAVHRSERLTDLLCSLRLHGMEPKRLRFVLPRSDGTPSLVLLEAKRGGKSGLRIEPPLVIGSPEWECVYFR